MAGLTDRERRTVLEALQRPVGSYVPARASQLSGLPYSTLSRWVRRDMLEIDYQGRPALWSYRDVVYARLFGLLRAKGMKTITSVQHVARIRRELAHRDYDEFAGVITADNVSVLHADEDFDPLTGQAVLGRDIRLQLGVFDALVPLDDEGLGSRRRLWGPHLITPSDWTRITPSVVGGEPCIRKTRIPTASLFSLHVDRGLEPSDIIALFPGAPGREAIEDGIALERKLRGLDKDEAA